MTRFSVRHDSESADVLKKTLKSYSANEKGLSILLIVLMLFSAWRLMTRNWLDRDWFALLSGSHNYNEGMVGEMVRLNPVYAELNEVDRDITSLIFEGLAKYDPREKKMVEQIATHTLDGSKTLYTFVLKEGLTWHDGVPLTSEDVYFTYHDVIQDEKFENPILKSSFSGVEMTLVDSRTLTMKLNEPNSFFFSQLTVGILPKHLLKDIPVDELDSHEFNQFPIGNGPYRVVAPYEREGNGDTRVELEYYDDYWEKADPDFDEINLIAFPSYEDLLDGLGKIHGFARIPHYRLEEFSEERFVPYSYNLPQYTALFMNTDSDPLKDRNARLGIQKAIDKQKIIEAISYDRTIDTPLLELNQEDWIYQANAQEAAGALFDAGWHLDEVSGLRMNEEGDEVFSLTLIRRSYLDNEKQEEVNRITADNIVDQLAELGVQVTVKTYEAEAFQQNVRERNYDLLLYGQSLGYNLDTYSYWHSSQVGAKGLNLSNYTNAKVDFSIEAIRNTFDENGAARQDYLNTIAEMIRKDIPAVFLYTPTYYFLADRRIQNVHSRNLIFPHDRFANILEWKVSE